VVSFSHPLLHFCNKARTYRYELDDLRYVLAISRAADLNAAARQLGVNTSSVFRRLGALEQQLEVRLFERIRIGLPPDTGGRSVRRNGRAIEGGNRKRRAQDQGHRHAPGGHIRLNRSDIVVQYALPKWLAEFRQTYPEGTMEIAVTADYVDLSSATSTS